MVMIESLNNSIMTKEQKKNVLRVFISIRFIKLYYQYFAQSIKIKSNISLI